MKRRTFLNRSANLGVITLTAMTGLLKPGKSLASRWPMSAFVVTKPEAALTELFGKSESTPTREIKIKAPLQSKGDSVPVSVSTTLPDVRCIALMDSGDDCALHTIVYTPGAGGYYSSRIRLKKTTDIVAYVQSGNKIYHASRRVKINVGGYGMQ